MVHPAGFEDCCITCTGCGYYLLESRESSVLVVLLEFSSNRTGDIHLDKKMPAFKRALTIAILLILLLLFYCLNSQCPSFLHSFEDCISFELILPIFMFLNPCLLRKSTTNMCLSFWNL